MGAKSYFGLLFNVFAVSIHAPVMGANQAQHGQAYQLRRFNPRTRDGCEHTSLFEPYLPCCFNPRTRDGCEQHWVDAGLIEVFQSTHP